MTVFRSSKRDVSAPDFHRYVLVNNRATVLLMSMERMLRHASTSVFGATKNVSSDSSCTKLCLNETPDAQMVKSGNASSVRLADIRRMCRLECIF